MMPFQHAQTHAKPIPLPVPPLSETRRAFPQFALLYEIEFLADNPWQGLGFVATECGRAGLELVSLRCTADGLILCKIKDSRARIETFAERLAAGGPVRLQAWTTVVTFEKVPHR